MRPRFKPKLGWQEFLCLFRPHSGSVRQFEKAFAVKFKACDAVAFPYGRAAQRTFLQAVGLKDSDVIMPAYTCSVVAHAISLSQNKPVFVDINLQDYNMRLDMLEKAVTSETRAVIATHTFGYAQDLDRLEDIVEKASTRFGHKIWLIQDCCHAFDAAWKGRQIGTSGDVAIYALNISKMMTSVFGGMLTFQDQALADKVRAMRDLNYKRAGWRKSCLRRLYLLAVFISFHPIMYALTWFLQKRTRLLDRFTKAFHLDEQIAFPPDHDVMMCDFEAAIGLVQLSKYDDIITKRRSVAQYYDENLLLEEGWVKPPIVDGATYSHYVVRVPDRQKTIDEYAKKSIELGELIQYSIPATKPYLDQSGSCPNAWIASQQTVNFPVS